MKQLLIGTNNLHKVKEMAKTLKSLDLAVLSPSDLGLHLDPPETGTSFTENATQKVLAWSQASKLPALVEDSGLCVHTLNGQPGIHSKRFFPGSDADKNQYLLARLQGTSDRSAFYMCAMAFYDPSANKQFHTEGKCEGKIAQQALGTRGFGFDPVFIPDGYTQSFGELPARLKRRISHRAKALALMLPFLQQWSKA